MSISGQITLDGRGLSGIPVELRGYKDGTAACVIKNSVSKVTDAQGKYRFSNLPSGYYVIRPTLPGYTFHLVRPNLIVEDGTEVLAGALIALSGNAGPCMAPHLHFEVQKKAPTFISVDPYGSDGEKTDCAKKTGDPYPCITGMSNTRLWAHRPVVDSINPSRASAGGFDLTITGDGFDPAATEKLVRQSDFSTIPLGTIVARSSTQLVVRESLTAGVYFVHVKNSDGRQSNWKKLEVK